MRQTHALLLLAALGTGACSFDLNTNPNSPDQIGENPSRSQVSATANGMLISLRQEFADFALDLGILGREAYRFDGSDPRFTGELLTGPLDPGGGAFGGDHWSEEFNSIRAGNNLLAVLSTAQALTGEEQSATSGYVKTIQALDFLMILDTHTQDSIPIDVGIDVTAPPAAFVSNSAAYARVMQLLDEAQAELAAGGGAFPFGLPPGFAGFDTPATFTQFNRALRARVAIYQNQFADALTALAGLVHRCPGRPQRWRLHELRDRRRRLRQLALDRSAERRELRAPLDPERCPAPGRRGDPGPAVPRQGSHPPRTELWWPDRRTSAGSGIPSPTSPIPIIKNEELILLRAEANIGLSDLGPALTDINPVRTTVGQPACRSAGSPTPIAALTELLYNKLYSLLYEGGHRWIDARHYGRLNTLPIDRPSGRPTGRGLLHVADPERGDAAEGVSS